MVTTPFRGEHWELSYGHEYAAGTTAAGLKGFLGIFDRANLPDPEIEWQPIYGAGGMTNRGMFRNIRGNWTMSGGVSDVIMLSGAPLQYLYGTKCYSWGAQYTGMDTYITGDVAAGATQIAVNAAGSIAVGHIIQIGLTPDGSRQDFELKRPEVRTVSNVSGSTITFLEPLRHSHTAANSGADSGKAKRINPAHANAYYGHLILEDTTLPTMTWLSSMWRAGDASNAPTLIRRYTGGKVARGSIRMEEGERVRYNFDDIIFTDMRYNDERDNPFASTTDPSGGKYLNSLTASAPTIPTIDPFFASSVSVYYNPDNTTGITTGNQITSVRNLQLEVNNNAEARYYVAGHDPATPTAHSVLEGNREYTLTMNVDSQDSNFYADMLEASQQTLSSVTDITGFQMRFFINRDQSVTNNAAAFSVDWKDGIRIDIPEPVNTATSTAMAHASTYKGDLSASNQGAILRTGGLAPGGDPVVQQEMEFSVKSSRVEVHDQSTWETTI